jgi:hypothetical protein
MTETRTAPRFSTEELARLLGLLEGADSVELKLTVPDGDQRSAVRALHIDPLDAQLSQVFFLDTPDLLLNARGVILRARRTKVGDDSVVKLRPVVPQELPDSLRARRGFGVEVDAMPGGFVCSGRLKSSLRPGKVKEAVYGDRATRSLFNKAQRAFLAEHAPEGIGIEDLSVLGPITVLKLKFRPPATTADWWPSCGPTRTGRGSWSCPPSARRPRRSRWRPRRGCTSRSAVSTSRVSRRPRPGRPSSSSHAEARSVGC